ncbi:tyrosyl-DNA phosphodiesterase-domain-containing protein [Crucibulum laeve]|uniref:Tyrosyl-DNA phosphodiesterase-domain-containing protein n=1 Tax=Crucibulum laeve TaxID=68775 RepID=A0A5C3LTA1_9AGAR|nr:tyrosyl-DNA phosphodiesterase-domain-containing protein [Crucibulum laeve]
MDPNEDDDLARAIALSLQDAQRKTEVITIDDSDEESDDDARFQAELKRALEASRAEEVRKPEASTSKPQVPPLPKPQPAEILQSQHPASVFLSERAQLEKERRERQKRLRKQAGLDDDEDQPKSNANGADDDEDDIDKPPAKRQHFSSSSNSRTAYADKRGVSSSGTASSSKPTREQLFWDGECRQTAAMHAEPRKDGKPTFRLTDILGKTSDIAFAIMSSYALDFPWIYQFFDPSVPVIMVAQPDATGAASVKNVLPNWIKTTPPLRGGFGCQHMKFMLLFHKTGRLRVVISTANLIAYDWRDMENTVWLQDVPLRASPTRADPKVTDDFPAVLTYVLGSLNIRPALSSMIMDNHPDLAIKSIEEIRTHWDWSKVKAHLVPSIAGKHEGWPAVIKTGHPRLMMVVRKLGLRTGKGVSKKQVVLECQGSSIGIYTTQWMNEFHYSARGESAEDWLDKPKKQREKASYPPIKVVFPTLATVRANANGESGGGTIFCRRRQWSAKNFPKDHFYDSKSKAGPVLMHSKMIIATKQDLSSNSEGHDSDTEDDSDDDEIQVIDPAIGWAYVGSHNFTPSAWGTLSGSSFNPILNISNYEVGVVFPLKDEEAANQFACFERPPKKYASGRDEPWIQEESVYHQPDA